MMSQVRIRIPERIKPGEIVTVRALVSHPMEMMAFKGGKPVERNYNFVHKVEATYNGRKVFEAATTQAVSQNPFVSFTIKADAPGVVKVVFHDTQGKAYEGQVEIKF
ncbi:MAG: thiosulfate oxidation carrier complex protein SoxZ [Betaproteobacteria bacterium]|nr:thiosulfate oxidation carrier complex protein SoxZ [Betaproteobacteria bacterium]